jgi:hypothetical protein
LAVLEMDNGSIRFKEQLLGKPLAGSCQGEYEGSGMVGATGVEPARISPKDPKSFASANSATRPDSLSIFAAAGTTVNTFYGGDYSVTAVFTGHNHLVEYLPVGG